jgi:hypothetical protein
MYVIEQGGTMRANILTLITVILLLTSCSPKYSGTNGLTLDDVAILDVPFNIITILSLDGETHDWRSTIELLPGQHVLKVKYRVSGYNSYSSASPKTFKFMAVAGHTYTVETQIWDFPDGKRVSYYLTKSKTK